MAFADETGATADGTHTRRENTLARSRLYSRFARRVADEGVTAFAGTTKKTTQGLSLTNLFSFDQRTGKASAILEPLSVPVRAIVVPLPGDSSAARKIRRETRDALRQFFPPAGGDFGHGDSVWFQDSELFHFSVFHASHHGAPVPASELEKNDELDAVRRVAAAACPMDVVVERVVVSPSGAVMALWNVEAGAEPSALRERCARRCRTRRGSRSSRTGPSAQHRGAPAAAAGDGGRRRRGGGARRAKPAHGEVVRDARASDEGVVRARARYARLGAGGGLRDVRRAFRGRLRRRLNEYRIPTCSYERVEYFTIRCGAENRADSRSVTVARRRGAFAETER